MINNDNDHIFHGNFMGDSNLSCLYDFRGKDEDKNEMNAFYSTESLSPPIINSGATFCDPMTNHNILNDWPRNGTSLPTTITSQSIASQQSVCSPGQSQYSKPILHHVQTSNLPENKRFKTDDTAEQEEDCTFFEGVRQSLDKTHPDRHSRKGSTKSESDCKDFTSSDRQRHGSFSKMVSSYPSISSPSWKMQCPTLTTQQNGAKSDVIPMYVMKCLTEYGFCALDNFMGEEAGLKAFDEVMTIENQGLFEGGRLASQEHDSQSVRGDKIFWIENDAYSAISKLIMKMDGIIFKLQKSFAGKSISTRTKPMVACYPGLGAAYRRHVDNSNQDGRLITCLYYLNKNWDLTRDGGLLRLYPTSSNNKSPIEIEPSFDRILLFWSDSRNPHEVLPAFRNRYAITIWYFDKEERERAMKRCRERK